MHGVAAMEASGGRLSRRIPLLALALALVVAIAGLAGCTQQGGGTHREAGTLEIGVAFPADDWRTAYVQSFAQEIEQESGGTIKTRMHYMDEYPDMLDLLREMNKDPSNLDIVLSANAYLADFSYPEFYASGLPYLFEDFEDAWDFADSDLNARIESKLPQYGMRVLSHFCGGFRNMGAVKPIEEPSDLDGLVVATVKSPIIMDMLFMLGANPQPSIAGELHDALGKGVYNGIEVSLATYWRDRDYDFLPYAAITNHSYNLWSLIIDENAWQGLSEENQAIVKAAAEKYANQERAESKAVSDDIIAKLKETDVAITHPDHETFKAATEPVREKYSASYRDTYEEMMRYLDQQS